MLWGEERELGLVRGRIRYSEDGVPAGTRVEDECSELSAAKNTVPQDSYRNRKTEGPRK